jgi:DeoR/GlpR family transcriptional regulator of sugar metabolism
MSSEGDMSTEAPSPHTPGRPSALAPSLRRRNMLRWIETEGIASVADLARAYGVSAVTIHRDLEALAGEGAVERVRGGVRSLTAPNEGPQRDFERRLQRAGNAKRTIAACAARLVKDRSTIFLDSSTTCLALARELERAGPSQITLVTNSPSIAFELNSPSIHLILAPGEVDQSMLVIGGRWTVEFLAELNLETAFISGAGLTLEHGLTTAQRAISDVLRAATAQAQETVALVDASKFGTHSLLTAAPLEVIDRLIVDQAIDPELPAIYERAGVQVTVAPAMPTMAEHAEAADQPAPGHGNGSDDSGGAL